MKKKEIVRFPRSGKLRQIGRMMKLMVLFMILGCVSVSARSDCTKPTGVPELAELYGDAVV